MRSHDGDTFVDAEVPLDGEEFHNCKFRGCTLIYSGGVPPIMTGNIFTNSRVTFDGAAARTVAFMRAMYHGGFKPVVEEAIDKITKRSP